MQKRERTSFVQRVGDGKESIGQRLNRLNLGVVVGTRSRTISARVAQRLFARVSDVLRLRRAFDIQVVRRSSCFEYLRDGPRGHVDRTVDMLGGLTTHRRGRG